MLGNPDGEVIRCNPCGRIHDIKRGTMMWCACGEKVFSKQYVKKSKTEQEICKIINDYEKENPNICGTDTLIKFVQFYDKNFNGDE